MDILMYLKAFVVGGGICIVGQLLLNLTKLTSGKILLIFMVSGIILSSLGLYKYLVDFAGAGASVPIVGFGHVLAQGAIEGAKVSIFEAIVGGLKASSVGISSAIIFGYIVSLIFKSKTKVNK